MEKQNQNQKSNIESMQYRILFLFVAIIVVTVISITTVVLHRSRVLFNSKISSLVSANSRQIELNIDNYMKNVESTATLLFSDKEYYKYDPITTTLDEYEQIKAEERIASRIVDLALMQNYSDFAVVYSNGKRVGWTSNMTLDTFPTDEIFSVLEGCITNERTEDGWAFGIGGITDKIFYVKRLNENAILMTSFYSRELSNVFKYPNELEGMIINLVDEDNTILFSSDTSLIASSLDPNIQAILDGSSDKEVIVNANYCGNGWRVVCQIPTAIILQDLDILRNNVIFFVAIFSMVLVASGYLLISGLIKPVDKAVKSLVAEAETDELSGLYNKSGFQDIVVKHLSESSPEDVQIFVMIDMDNFKRINDTLGHSAGDKVISKMGYILKTTLGDSYICGRLGGDEFAVYASAGSTRSVDEIKSKVSFEINTLYETFNETFAKERAQLNISLSMGAIVTVMERRFANLYSQADKALYESKNSGKNRMTFYEEGGME